VAGELTWFELGVGDLEKAYRFYGELFGWSFENTSERGALITGAGPGGGIHPGDAGGGPYVFFEVSDLDAAMEQVRSLGGEADVLPTDEPGEYGRFALCKDDQGSSFGLREPRAGGQGPTR
jgi:predicted enzyme related to lactoylglutathione lyase